MKTATEKKLDSKRRALMEELRQYSSPPPPQRATQEQPDPTPKSRMLKLKAVLPPIT